MNERIKELALQAGLKSETMLDDSGRDIECFVTQYNGSVPSINNWGKFAELVVKDMCEMMEQAEDDAYHCFEPSERPTQYIEWLSSWRERFTEHFGVENGNLCSIKLVK